MTLIDYAVASLPLLICLAAGLLTRRFVRGVADFLAGGRAAGRYLISTARSEQGAGAVVFVASFQQIYAAGFTLSWWYQLSVPVTLLVAISGFVIYRYRQTRAMTLAQFFEMRYSRRFRSWTGVIGFIAGVINFGVIPVIGAKFVVFYLGLPQAIHLGSFEIATYLPTMAVLLSICVLTTISGGQVTVLLTDCLEGMFSQIMYVFIACVLLVVVFDWHATKTMLLDRPPGESLVNPFDSLKLKDFNLWYVLMALFVNTYATMAWQNSHAFNSSAATPHESRMGGILGRWRAFASGVMVIVLAVCAMTYLSSATGHSTVAAALSGVSDPTTADQMRVPVALSHLLPAGVRGALLAVCLMGIIAGDGIHLHSWSSILVQDVILPLRKKRLSTEAHLRLLRWAIVGVAVFAFVFGALFPQTKYVQMWWAITQPIFTGGAGAAIIGGLYWSRGTTAGAWWALATGSLLSLAGIGVGLYCRLVLGHEFFLNGQEIAFYTTLAALAAYVLVSLATCRQPFDMDRLLHRGQYAVADDAAPKAARVNWLYRIIGIDSDFTVADRWVTIGIFAWSILWFGAFVVGSIAYQFHPWSNATWADYWLWTSIYLPLAIALVTTVWFTIGCTIDLRVFFRRLSTTALDPHDDGSVAPAASGLTPEAVLDPAADGVRQLDRPNLTLAEVGKT